jgi:hypothetical protein
MNVPPLITRVDTMPDSRMMVGDGSSSEAPAIQVASAASPTSIFIAKVIKPVGVVLPCPPPPKPRKKTLPEDFVPRRSRRVAKLPPVSDHKVVASVCCQLQFMNGEEKATDGEEGISEEALEQYVRIFEQTLSYDHVKALAALFGWNAPSCDDACSMSYIFVA